MKVQIELTNGEIKEYEIPDNSPIPAKDLVMKMQADGLEAKDLKQIHYIQ